MVRIVLIGYNSRKARDGSLIFVGMFRVVLRDILAKKLYWPGHANKCTKLLLVPPHPVNISSIIPQNIYRLACKVENIIVVGPDEYWMIQGQFGKKYTDMLSNVLIVYYLRVSGNIF